MKITTYFYRMASVFLLRRESRILVSRHSLHTKHTSQPALRA